MSSESSFKDYWDLFINAGKEVGVAAVTKPTEISVNQGAEKTATNGLKIGDVEISTSTILWTIGGTLGLLLVAGVAKKLLK